MVFTLYRCSHEESVYTLLTYSTSHCTGCPFGSAAATSKSQDKFQDKLHWSSLHLIERALTENRPYKQTTNYPNKQWLYHIHAMELQK